jgi:RNA polymerase primary sigma factor
MRTLHEAGSTDDILKIYYERVKHIPLLTAQDERNLSIRIQDGDESAKSRLIESNLRLVIKIARAFSNFDVPLIDLIQEGNLGLIKAAERFDYRKNVRFSTYASWWIRQSITRSMVNTRRAIRLPHRKEDLIRRIHKTSSDLSQVLGCAPSHADIAEELLIEESVVRETLELAGTVMPLEAFPDNEEIGSIIDIYEDRTYSPESELMRSCLREQTMDLLDALMEKERQVLMYRFEFFGSGKQTLKRIGENMNLSAETIRQIEKRAIRKLREQSEDFVGYLGA